MYFLQYRMKYGWDNGTGYKFLFGAVGVITKFKITPEDGQLLE
ncbi:hypothetical protein [Fictibacillus terranigra]|uniref:Uncharacterized protein n=1 Tax=Fictibacillus terranigra TaxID=3058424 RepID=A0ABT8EDE6_9BACL|nr:hypothetical protein [Fictibacillus sp. CENA-BCM004]MDN4075929.1 hypothetical protein [Fictibacillus sp. CENA-BCM004]